jgi:phosphoenolpyruvate carboxykinase (GTP)
VRRDPFAMLPFAGYNMGDYFAHWLEMGRRGGIKLPRIFRVNWFRRDETNKLVWPGYGQNMRVLKWIVDRVHGRADAVDGPLGLMPRYGDLDWKGLDFDRASFQKITDLRREAAKGEIEGVKTWFAKFGEHLPREMSEQLAELAVRVEGMPETWRAD